jgi:ankyrin repeat protein
MPARRLPVYPDLDQLRHQAKDLLRALHAGDAEALADLKQFHTKQIDPAKAKLADAQLVLARSYEASGWTRLVLAARLIDAIWRDDLETVRSIIEESPKLLHENAGIRNNNWGPPLSYAANVGRDAIIRMLYEHGARDLQHAIGRATLQGKIETAKMLYEMLGAPPIPRGALGGPAYTLSSTGTAFLFEHGATAIDENGATVAPVNVVICSDSRKPVEKHRILEMYVQHGAQLPDTPVMALHRGRIDLLDEHLRRDPQLFERTFSHQEIFPREFGCSEYVDTQGTPLHGTTLLHMCIDWDEFEILEWLVEKGADVNAKSAVDQNGFGGYTPLFGVVVCYANFWGNYRGEAPDTRFAKLLLDHGAYVNVRSSIRRMFEEDGRKVWKEFRDLTPLSWGDAYPAKILVSQPAMRMIEQRGGLR